MRGRLPTRSHAPRGNALFDAPRRPGRARATRRGTRSVPDGIPTRSVGTRSKGRGGELPILSICVIGGSSFLPSVVSHQRSQPIGFCLGPVRLIQRDAANDRVPESPPPEGHDYPTPPPPDRPPAPGDS